MGSGKHLKSVNGSWWTGRNHSEETKTKISEALSISQSGSKNSQYGTMWITNAIQSRKIEKDVDVIPEEWYKGHNMK